MAAQCSRCGRACAKEDAFIDTSPLTGREVFCCGVCAEHQPLRIPPSIYRRVFEARSARYHAARMRADRLLCELEES